MEAAKDTVKKFIGRSGHHDTEVDEQVRAPVTNEQIRPHRHEETTTAIDKEVHQDHYHTTVQPLQHKETLPEKHTHQQLPVEQREVSHGDSSKIKAAVQSEAAQFTNTSTTHGTTHSASQGATVGGEHVHHHVHETVQPVINKDTIQPEIVHTTRPIHEVHHAQAEHHGISTLPTKTLSEFKSVGGQLAGSGQRHEEYEGHPRPYNPELQGTRTDADIHPRAHDGLHASHPSEQNLTGNTGQGQHTGTGLGSGHHTSGTTGGLTSGTSGLGSSGHHTSGTTGGLTSGTGLGSSGHHTSGTTGGLTSGTGLGSSGHHTSGTTGGLTSGTTGHSSSGHTGVLGSTGKMGEISESGRNVSGLGSNHPSGADYTSGGGLSSTGTALGGRTEGNTVGRAVDAATGHSSGVGNTHGGSGYGVGSTGSTGIGSGTTGRGFDQPSVGHTTTGGYSSSDRGVTDTLSSTNSGSGRHADTGLSSGVGSDGVQHPSQGRDPNLVESDSHSSGLKGQGVPGSHSAVFGLTPDGKTYDDTQHGTGKLQPAHSSSRDNSATGDMGSRAPTGSGIASQMQQVSMEDRHRGSSGIGSSDTQKPGAGSFGTGSQGFGQVRPGEHGGESKMMDKLDPTTDSNRDGKRGIGS